MLSLPVQQGSCSVFAENYSQWGPEDCVKPPPAEAAQLTLQVLYRVGADILEAAGVHQGEDTCQDD